MNSYTCSSLGFECLQACTKLDVEPGFRSINLAYPGLQLVRKLALTTLQACFRELGFRDFGFDYGFRVLGVPIKGFRVQGVLA